MNIYFSIITEDGYKEILFSSKLQYIVEYGLRYGYDREVEILQNVHTSTKLDNKKLLELVIDFHDLKFRRKLNIEEFKFLSFHK